MDINNSKVNNLSNVFDKLIGKSNTYIPALHKKTADAFVRTTKNVSFKGDVVTKEGVLTKLKNIDISDEVKENIEKKLGKQLETQGEIDIVNKFLSNPVLYGNEKFQKKISIWASKHDDEEAIQAKLSIMDKYLADEDLQKSQNAQDLFSTSMVFVKNSQAAGIATKILSTPLLYENADVVKNYSSICSWCNDEDAATSKDRIIDVYLANPDLYENEKIQNVIGQIMQKANGVWSGQIAAKFLSEPNLYNNSGLQRNIPSIVSAPTTDGKYDIVNAFLSKPELYENEVLQETIDRILFQAMNPEDLKYSTVLLGAINNGDIKPALGLNLIKNAEKVRYKQVRKLKERVPEELFEKVANSAFDLPIIANVVSLYGAKSIDEIPLSERRNLLRGLIKNNSEMFYLAKYYRDEFPLMPQSKEEYCSLLPALVRSLGIETKPLSEKQISEFERDIHSLSSSVAELSEKDFDDLKVSLSYGKNEFIKDVVDAVKGLPSEEYQKVYDYFGFDIKKNYNNPTGYSLLGYPINMYNGEKLAQISDEKTRSVIEELRPKVIEFSENNSVHSNNKKLESLLSSVLDVLPELYTTIDRPQHGQHQYDVFKHSLKVMQKIAQNPQFENLNESDKKVILLGSLLHDITKAEGKADPKHALECSFDAFYIAKKFNLSQDEQTKLYTLINTHEWLKYANEKNITDMERTKRLQSVAFDLQNSNLFEMSKIFTEADIKAIKKDNGLYYAFGPALENLSKPIEEYIAELKKTKPILPTIKLPKATDVERKITTVNADSSTNIKGVYKKDGLIVIKYNEVENWEELGFPKGSTSRGIQVENPIDGSLIDTGTIKFIAHGLTESNQLSNFNAFNLPGSDALLSVSYMERPESKYRLYKKQGVLLNVPTDNIYGGGKTDSGSGKKKSIDDFKLNYIFGGHRERDRNYISNLIKENLGLTDEEYVDFVEKNSNKSILEIEPQEVRETLIKSFALINSNIRLGDREYNEMYVSNPVIQGVFAYSPEDNVGEVSQFIDNQEAFLKDYAKQNDLLFFIFGD